MGYEPKVDQQMEDSGGGGGMKKSMDGLYGGTMVE